MDKHPTHVIGWLAFDGEAVSSFSPSSYEVASARRTEARTASTEKQDHTQKGSEGLLGGRHIVGIPALHIEKAIELLEKARSRNSIKMHGDGRCLHFASSECVVRAGQQVCQQGE